ncbi:sodium/hydrogen exchanger 2-like isoform X2 [Bacillus rossius redtenbacheri]|uniref:sodium/hydrogen exchanger 2-like isoform X2 n=1 Tax=Bacillus rossius redtenbacheri TaxID=93214 RepID=UPI002FDD76F7
MSARSCVLLPLILALVAACRTVPGPDPDTPLEELAPAGPGNGSDANTTALSPLMEDELLLSQPHHGVHVANWRWDEIGLFFAFSLFIVTAGLAKVAFHHAHLSTHIPESCLMIIVGITVGGFIYLSGVPVPSNEENHVVPQLHVREFAILTFTPRLFFLVLLPPVILESAYSLYDQAFSCNFYTIMLYAVVGTIFNMFTIGPILFALSSVGVLGRLQLNPAPGAPPYRLAFTDCLVFSALISAVDPVSVLAIFQEVGVNKDLYYLVFGESLFNDAVTVVLYTTMVTFSEMGEIPSNQYLMATAGFLTVNLGGCVVGVLFGLVTALLTRATEECRVVEPLAILGVSYLSYLTAELFHFSGIISITFCGLVQAHYAFKNISRKSYITVKYFSKMVSSTCDAIIFLFLGMVLVSDRHVWHAGFVLWTLALCFVCRFVGVYLLSGLANLYRARRINLQEQFVMAYGGLRGAVAFSLVEMLEADTVPPRQVFVTTTLVVIIFTVFVQGGTIKPLVNLLNIKRTHSSEKMNEEIHDHVITTIMAGVEEISGVRGDLYIQRKLEQIDELYLKKIFLKSKSDNNITRRFEKLALTQHYAHLYGPVILIEDKKVEALRSSEAAPPRKATPSRSHSFRSGLRLPKVDFRRRTVASRGEPRAHQDAGNTEALRQAFRSNPYQKMQTWRASTRWWGAPSAASRTSCRAPAAWRPPRTAGPPRPARRAASRSPRSSPTCDPWPGPVHFPRKIIVSSLET